MVRQLSQEFFYTLSSEGADIIMYNFSPYMQQMQPMMPQQNMPPIKTDIVKVSGEPGARAYIMAPNSEALLLDANDPIVWLCQTDGAGYKTLTAYDIKPHVQAPPAEYTSLEARIAKLEERLNESNNANAQTGN